jgi:hypothetical protein
MSLVVLLDQGTDQAGPAVPTGSLGGVTQQLGSKPRPPGFRLHDQLIDEHPVALVRVGQL